LIYSRCVEQAKEEGRTLEEIAAERWGVCTQYILSKKVFLENKKTRNSSQSKSLVNEKKN